MGQQSTRKSIARNKKALIYLVDDENLLLDLAELTLRPEGYRIKKFNDPKVALQSFLREKTKPVLLVTDFAMASMNGLELITQCKLTHPPLRSILLSGTAGAEIIHSAPVRVDQFLCKPYQPASLAQRVRQLLEQPKARPAPRPAARKSARAGHPAR